MEEVLVERCARAVQVGPFLERKLEPVEVLDEEGLKQIEANAEIILSEIGIAFQDFQSFGSLEGCRS